MSGTKQTAIIVGSVAGGVVGSYILLKIGKMAWDRYTATVSDPVFYPESASGIDLNQPMEENEEDTQPKPATPRKKTGGSSQKNKKHKRRTRRHHRK